MTLRRVVILHGFAAGPAHHWFGWLRDQMAPLGVETVIPQLPDPSNPRPEAWIAGAREAIGVPSPEVAVIGHSLGTITALHAVAELLGAGAGAGAGSGSGSGAGAELGGLALVAPFAEAVPGLTQLDPFAEGVPALPPLAARIRHRLVVRSDHDAIVPVELAAPIVAQLRADEVVVPGGGHFIESEGWATLPALADWLRPRATP